MGWGDLRREGKYWGQKGFASVGSRETPTGLQRGGNVSYKTLTNALLTWEQLRLKESSPVVFVSIQIVEGNVHLRSLLGWHLQQAGYRVYQSADIHQAREVFHSRQPTLVIVEAELPDGDGIEFCRWLSRQQHPLILMLSARNLEADIVAGLKAGADDYLTKPFGMQEFLARVEALVRRQKTTLPPASLDYGDLKIDLIQRRVSFKGDSIDLTPQEFSLLYALAQVGGAALSRSELLHRAWPDSIDNPRTVDTHILSLRKKLEIDPRQPSLIQTVRNVGYRFNQEMLNGVVASVTKLDLRKSPPVTTTYKRNGRIGNLGTTEPSMSSITPDLHSHPL